LAQGGACASASRVGRGVAMRTGPPCYPGQPAAQPPLQPAAHTPAQAPILQPQPQPVALPQPRPFHAARELLARAGEAPGDAPAESVPKARRRRKKSSISIPGARLEHLMCFYDNLRLQNELKAADETSAQQEQDLQEVNHMRSEEVVRLTLEAVGIQEQLDLPEDLLCCDMPPSPTPKVLRAAASAEKGVGGGEDGEPRAAPSRVELEESVRLRWKLVERLQRRSAALRAECAELQAKALEAEREATQQQAKLAVCQESHAQEAEHFRSKLPQWPPAGVPETSQEVALERTRRLEAEGKSQLAVDRLGAQQARALLESERQLHREQAQRLERELRLLRARADASAGSSLRASCEAVQGPANRFLAALGRAPVETGSPERWAAALCDCLANLTVELADAAGRNGSGVEIRPSAVAAAILAMGEGPRRPNV